MVLWCWFLSVFQLHSTYKYFYILSYDIFDSTPHDYSMEERGLDKKIIDSNINNCFFIIMDNSIMNNDELYSQGNAKLFTVLYTLSNYT